MTLAALPDHNRLTDPLWRTLFHGYRHVITPLRHNGWTTDVETCGGEYHLRAALSDGTELIIAASQALPADPAEVDGWSVVRQNVDNPDVHTAVYDSTPGGPQRHHGTSLIPLLARIDELDAPKTATRLIFSATHTHPSGANANQTAGIEAPGTAVARFFEWSHRLITVEGYRKVWERPETEGYPLALFERDGHITTYRITPWHD
ncbi:hypothetical protein [Streptantibioticus ferralitis]|uniref:Uncharacterized protein n=1 Tax=Streptantibioticus ferralitis TaxID=236510 RepID=A0ABT5Z002_9ACTN|nr:hypothetical protein [Streptantibioticus ferralitis]MDF2257164.1 hypothetical protein [Streptantibioticus ferralitis]